MNGFSAYHISSRGLKYALAYSAFDQGEVEQADYKKALLNVLTAQDFDSIPLVESYGGPITAIGRRRLHDGDLDDVFILSTEEVSKLPQTAPVIRCIFEVLSNEHHIVFLTDEDDVITDVVTISMLTTPLIQEYLTLLISKLTSEGWDFNEQHLNSAFVPTYDYPKIIHEELKKLGELVDHPKGEIPSDFDVSKQIVHILSLLQPLKLWEGGQGSEALTSTDYPLKIVTPDYKPGTAGYFAQHPFGAVMENAEHPDVQDLAFRLFSKANNWDCLLLKPQSGEYVHLLQMGEYDTTTTKFELGSFVNQDVGFEELIDQFDNQNRPLCIHFQNSNYPGIVTLQDVVFSEYSKSKMLSMFLSIEVKLRDIYMHHLSGQPIKNNSKYNIVGFKQKKKPVWAISVRDIYNLMKREYPLLSKEVLSGRAFDKILNLRNSIAHNDFLITPQDEIDSEKTNGYISFLKNQSDIIQKFNTRFDIFNSMKYSAVATAFENEFWKKNGVKKSDFVDNLLHLEYKSRAYHFHFKNREAVQRARVVKEKLLERMFPWQCEVFLYTSKRAAEIVSSLENKVRQMLREECNDEKEIEYQHFRNQIKLIFKEMREVFSITKQEIQSITNVTKGAFSGGLSILEWCSLKFSRREEKDVDGMKTIFLKITNLGNDEEE